ncbi:MAG: GspH/FimT family pseudopilin [Nitrosomonas sp.]|nr:GspH/FimT family pseudopilin [Nitrosomonas sp.]
MILTVNKRNQGVTLVELMVAMAVLGILLAIGVPSFNQFTVNSRLTSYANSMLSNMSQARSEAIKRNNRVALCKSADGLVCNNGGDWDQGWIAFSDFDNNATLGGGDLLLFTMPVLANGYTFSGNANVANYVSFDTQGMARLTTGGAQAGTFTICPPAPAVGGNGRQIVLNFSGRARIATITTCP